jgi:2-polyprenyl-3-methyl-5-hydroxy-6-metoxy-1,4-benzoquinol methylase
MTPAIAKHYCPPEVYDLTYSDVVSDIAPHVAEARAAGGPVLEGCCGNGRLMIPTLEAGVDCDGFDIDPRMLEDLRRKLAERGLEAGLHHADMRDFELPRRYALIVIPFNSFLHNLTQEDQLATLACCREHLAPGGHLTIVAFHPSAAKLLVFDGAWRLAREIPQPSGTVRVMDSITADRVEQINSSRRRVEIVDADGRVTANHEFDFQIRYIWKPEMELLFRTAGFKRWQARSLFKSIHEHTPVDPARGIEEGDMLAWSAWKD